jgi:hypothetical protein
VQSYFLVARELSASYASLCTPQSGDTLIVEYPNKFFVSFVSTASDNTAYYQIDVQYNRFKQWSYSNDVRCAGVSNVKPDSGGGSNSTNNNTNSSSNPDLISGGITYLTVAKYE